MPRKTVINDAETVVAAPNLQRRSIIIQRLNILLQPFRERHERHYRDSQFHLWADIILATILIGAAVLLIWLLVWQPKPAFSLEARLDTSRILSGQSEEFIINFRNYEDADIKAATLRLEMPSNFIFESASPSDTFDLNSTTFLLGDLKKGEQGQLRIRGIVQGQINETQTLNLELLYQYKGVRKQVLDLFAYRIDGSALELSLDMSEKAFASIPSAGRLTVKNAGQAEIKNAAVLFASKNWTITIENTLLENGRVLVNDLKAGETRYIHFTAITTETGGQLPFEVQGQLLSQEKVLTQFQIAKMIEIGAPGLSFSAVFEDQALYGSEATLDLQFVNNEATEISNITIAVQNNRETFAITGITPLTETITASNSVLSYNQNLKAGEKASGKIRLKFDRKNIALNDFIALGVTVSYTINNQTTAYDIAVKELKVASNISLVSGGYYYSEQGDQIGIGPIPPKAGIPTTYWIIWEANNLGNDVSGFEVSADLPGNVAWLDQQSVVAGAISYSPITRRVLWQVDNLPKNGGNFRVSFAVSLVPGEGDIGTVPVLLSNIGFIGQDQFAGIRLSKKMANITTNIESDRRAAGRGKVEPLE